MLPWFAFALVGAEVQVNHEFRLTWSAPLQKVTVAGTFNGWNREATPMVNDGTGKNWSATVRLVPGQYLYKFVLDGTTWITDPANTEVSVDEGGNKNSILMVGSNGKLSPASTEDGVIDEEFVTHRFAMIPDVCVDQGQLELRLRLRTGDAKKVKLIAGTKTVAMRELGSDGITTAYSVRIPWSKKNHIRYRFELTDGSETFSLGPEGFSKVKAEFILNPDEVPSFTVPGWVERTVFYQIFPDRFENGNKQTDLPDAAAWTDEPTWFNHFGGDLAGIKRRIPNLKWLGINGVYINPIMKAPSSHRYDPGDFYQVDPEVGTNQEFAALTKNLKSAGIRTVLDQIFDHVGTAFPQFQDVIENQEESKFKDWFYIKSWPVKVQANPPYEGWNNREYMPKVNVLNPEVEKYLLGSVDYWMKEAQLAGWRLDVANEPPMEFWRKFRKFVKDRDPNAWIVGEVWEPAMKWLEGDQFDAAMNYPFRARCIKWIAKNNGTPTEFVNGLLSDYSLYAPQAARNQLNLLSSHDTPRFITEAKGSKAMQKLGFTVQCTWPGAPSIYYGEEVGMTGSYDPQNRRPMRWDLYNSSNSLLSYYRRLITIRRNSEVLAAGEPKALPCIDKANVAAYARIWRGEQVSTIINRSKISYSGYVELQTKPGKKLVSLSTSKYTADSKGRIKVTIPAETALIVFEDTPQNLAIIRSAAAASDLKNLNEELP